MTEFRRDHAGTYWVSMDPVAIKDFRIDWSDWLGDDTIATSTWEAEDAVEPLAPSVEGGEAMVWLSGAGELGDVAIVANTITTAGGRRDRRGFRVVLRGLS